MSAQFLNSFAHIDADGRLVYWDDGFAQEFQFAAPLFKAGVSYTEIPRAASAGPGVREFLLANSEFSDIELFQQRVFEGFEGERSGEYRTHDGRIIRVDRHRAASGGIRRFARDVTEERNAGGKRINAYQWLDVADAGLGGAVVTETHRTRDGNYFFQPIDESLQRLLDFPAELVWQDAIMVFARMKASAEAHARNGAQLEEAALTLKSLEQDYHVRDGKDRMRWIRHSMSPRREAEGTVIFSGIMQDVTRKKKAEDQVEMFRSVVVRSSDSIAIFESDSTTDHDAKIVYVNTKFSELFGWSADELIDKEAEVLAADRPVVARGTLAAARLRNDGEPVEFETSSRDGRVFWVEARVVTIQRFDDGRFRWVVISQDISGRRRAQDELLRAKEEAEAGNRAKGEFLANMSHELRTPLNAIIGFTELIQLGVGRKGWNESYREYLADISESGQHLLELINRILDLSKIEAGRLKLDRVPVNLCDLVRTSVALVSAAASEGEIALSIHLPSECPEIVGDYVKLQQMFLSIVSNAIKFTSPGGKVSVMLDFTETAAAILVADTGCGIAEADLERVVLPFMQAESNLSRRFGGSGLGLSVARKLCSLHGGTLDIDSIEKEGTAVRISLPRSGFCLNALLLQVPAYQRT